ncbi:MAG: hypothetical protein DI537_43335 [Stutzerimonas stutzeri]|nr:MAG: hypothetical protein DI537_43335 [Stutzerimonas stutzeri]
MTDFAALVAKHRTAIDQIQSGEIDELPEDAYQDFYEHYLLAGEMPYGTAKARTGDPYIWVNDRVLEDVKGVALF